MRARDTRLPAEASTIEGENNRTRKEFEVRLSTIKSKEEHKMKMFGAGVSAAAGPKGRDAIAATDVALRAEVLSYSRSRGLFAGAFLDGSTLRPDNDANKRLYNRSITAKEIVLESKVSPPSAAEKLLFELNKRSPKNLSS
jgi:lipid-binding SYLF domain-containing protein